MFDLHCAVTYIVYAEFDPDKFWTEKCLHLLMVTLFIQE